MPRKGFEVWRVTKHPQPSSGGNKSFSDILPGAASLTLDGSASFESIHDIPAGPSREAGQNTTPETAEAPAANAEQEADSLAVLTRNLARKRAETLLELVRNLRAARDEAEGDVIVFGDFPGPAYEIFLELVKKDTELYGRLKNYRCEYSHKVKEFVIRMPSKIHDGMAEFLGGEIAVWLAGLKKEEDPVTGNQSRAGLVAENIMSYGTADISILSEINNGDLKDVRQADKSYQYHAEGSKETLPDLVIEVVWSHPNTREQLAKRAEEYIVNSKGSVRTVVTIDFLDYYPDPSADGVRNKCGKFSVLRAQVDKRGRASVDEANSVRGKNFIDGVNEGHVAGANIELSLLDFVNVRRTKSLPEFEDAQIQESHLREARLVITAAQLYKRFKFARIDWSSEQAEKKPRKNQSQTAAPAAKQTTSKEPKSKGTKAGKKRKIQHR